MSWGADLLLDAEQNSEWRRATEIALRAADGFFCDCRTVRAQAQRFATILDERIVQFPWGIDRGSFFPHGPAVARETIGLKPDDFVFISTRSWEPLYDIQVLLQAFHRAWRQSSRLHLLLLGGGSEAVGVRSFIAEHGLSDAVVIPGTISGEEMPRWFRAANAYVSCAKSDGASVSLLQAMATGLPVVVTDIPSNREWIAEDKNGWLAPAGSSDEFASKFLRTVSLDAVDREVICERNQRIVTERADWDQNFPTLLRLYDDLVSCAVEMKA
jgi:glycosyltransferase involved in cell wall biosynthesis